MMIAKAVARPSVAEDASGWIKMYVRCLTFESSVPTGCAGAEGSKLVVDDVGEMERVEDEGAIYAFSFGARRVSEMRTL